MEARGRAERERAGEGLAVLDWVRKGTVFAWRAKGGGRARRGDDDEERRGGGRAVRGLALTTSNELLGATFCLTTAWDGAGRGM